MAEIASIPETHRDLIEARGVAVLSTVGSDGYPQSTALWYMVDGDVVRTSLHRTRQKFFNMVQHPKATLFVLDPANPYRTLEIRADVTFDDDDDQSFLVRLLAHYGQTLETFPAPADNRVVLTLTPHHVVTYGDAPD
ncbi:MAG: PPOX class F420-dependent enzyme [Acidimicrobiaceae bacterium]|nr:PPOX class F420-dependent enzyme [Acidimicrobiaceae bacterium]